MQYFFLFILLLILGCDTTDSEPLPTPPYSVGTLTFEIDSQGRTLPVQIWYPTTQVSTEIGIEHFETDMRRNILASLIDDSNNNCAQTLMTVSIDAPALSTPEAQPIILFSHCHSCTRFSSQPRAISSLHQIMSAIHSTMKSLAIPDR